jgi:radical SAM protein with 4Fe4S-binding SPASM domain
MKSQKLVSFYEKLHNRKVHFPLKGQIELTDRCDLSCVHCYCKAQGVTKQGPQGGELSTLEWHKIIDAIYQEGCLWLTFTGGDPLVRDDFLEIYSYAKNKGFIISLFTNGLRLTGRIIDYLVTAPPFSIEITLNGITKKTYESISQVEGSFSMAMANIKLLAQKKLHIILKANCLKYNKYEIGKIKRFTEELLGKPSEKKYRFQYDTMILPRRNGDRKPCNYRLSFEELRELRKQDSDLWGEYQAQMHSGFSDLSRDRRFLYHCNTWLTHFIISPYGRLKFCDFSDKFSVDLRISSLKDGFFKIFPRLLNEKFKTESKCIDCRYRQVCFNCPARAYLETGNEEAPVPYYCKLAKATYREMKKYKNAKPSLR